MFPTCFLTKSLRYAYNAPRLVTRIKRSSRLTSRLVPLPRRTIVRSFRAVIPSVRTCVREIKTPLHHAPLRHDRGPSRSQAPTPVSSARYRRAPYSGPRAFARVHNTRQVNRRWDPLFMRPSVRSSVRPSVQQQQQIPGGSLHDDLVARSYRPLSLHPPLVSHRALFLPLGFSPPIFLSFSLCSPFLSVSLSTPAPLSPSLFLSPHSRPREGMEA